MSDLSSPSEKVDLVKSGASLSSMLGGGRAPIAPSTAAADAVRPDYARVVGNAIGAFDAILLKSDEARSIQLSNDMQRQLADLKDNYFNDARTNAAEAQKSLPTKNSGGTDIVGEPKGNTTRERMLKFQNDANKIIQIYRNEMSKVDPRVRYLADKNAATFINSYSSAVYGALAEKANKDFLVELETLVGQAADNYARAAPNSTAAALAKKDLIEATHVFMSAQGYGRDSAQYKMGMRNTMSAGALAHLTTSILQDNKYKALKDANYIYNTTVKAGDFTAKDQLAALSKLHTLREQIKADEERERARREAAAQRAAMRNFQLALRQQEEQRRKALEIAEGRFSNATWMQLQSRYASTIANENKEKNAITEKQVNDLIHQGRSEEALQLQKSLLPVTADDPNIQREAYSRTANFQRDCKSRNTQAGIVTTQLIDFANTLSPEQKATVNSGLDLIKLAYPNADAEKIEQDVKSFMGADNLNALAQKVQTGMSTKVTDQETFGKLSGLSVGELNDIKNDYGDFPTYLKQYNRKLTADDIAKLNKQWSKTVGDEPNENNKKNTNALLEAQYSMMYGYTKKQRPDLIENLVGKQGAKYVSPRAAQQALASRYGDQINRYVVELDVKYFPDKTGESLSKSRLSNPQYMQELSSKITSFLEGLPEND